MPKKKARNGSARATLAGVRKEMSQSRIAKSARKEYAKIDSPLPNDQKTAWTWRNRDSVRARVLKLFSD